MEPWYLVLLAFECIVFRSSSQELLGLGLQTVLLLLGFRESGTDNLFKIHGGRRSTGATPS